MNIEITDVASNERLEYILDDGEDTLELSTLLNLRGDFEEVDLQVTLTCVNKLRDLYKTLPVN